MIFTKTEGDGSDGSGFAFPDMSYGEAEMMMKILRDPELMALAVTKLGPVVEGEGIVDEVPQLGEDIPPNVH